MRIFILLLFLFNPKLIVAQGIHFNETFGSWQELLHSAKKSNKSIFVDFYTIWCGPCKNMDRTVFNQKSVGEFYNTSFISIKLDAEKGWGIELAKKYMIDAYPTLLYFSEKGEVTLVEVGFKTKDVFLQLGRLAVLNSKNKINLNEFEKLSINSSKDSKAILSYIRKLSPLKTPNSLLLERYLESLPNDSLYTLLTLKLVSRNYYGLMPFNGIAFNVLHSAFSRYPVKSWEIESPWNIIRSRLLTAIDSTGKQNDFTRFEQLQKLNDTLEILPESIKREREYLLCKYYFSAKNTKLFMSSFKSFVENNLVNIDTNLLYKNDKSLFVKAKELKFNSPDKIWTYSDLQPKEYAKTFLSESRRTYDELLDLTMCYEYLVTNNHLLEKLPIKQWFQTGVVLYENSPVYHDPYMLQEGKKRIISGRVK